MCCGVQDVSPAIIPRWSPSRKSCMHVKVISDLAPTWANKCTRTGGERHVAPGDCADHIDDLECKAHADFRAAVILVGRARGDESEMGTVCAHAATPAQCDGAVAKGEMEAQDSPSSRAPAGTVRREEREGA